MADEQPQTSGQEPDQAIDPQVLEIFKDKKTVMLIAQSTLKSLQIGKLGLFEDTNFEWKGILRVQTPAVKGTSTVIGVDGLGSTNPTDESEPTLMTLTDASGHNRFPVHNVWTVTRLYNNGLSLRLHSKCYYRDQYDPKTLQDRRLYNHLMIDGRNVAVKQTQGGGYDKDDMTKFKLGTRKVGKREFVTFESVHEEGSYIGILPSGEATCATGENVLEHALFKLKAISLPRAT